MRYPRESAKLTIKIQIRIEEITSIRPTLLPCPRLPILLVQEIFLPRSLRIRHSFFSPNLQAFFVASFFEYHPCFTHLPFTSTILLILRVRRFGARSARANMQSINATQRRPIQIRLIRVHIPIETRINDPFHDLERGTKSRWQTVSNRMVEIISKD